MLDISVPLMLFDFVLFLTLLVLLNRMLYKPLLKHMDDRDDDIAQNLNKAKSMSGASEALHAEAKGILDEARSSASDIRQKAINDAKVLAESKAENKRAELDKKHISFMEGLESEKETLRNSLLSQMPLFKESLKAKFSKL
ncbi:MAG: F0F1 ATP synthase subunit B' [Epsilonproteobacteria bacterium]|nr:MAG: F0F1 ATP synthase subunit B' [Campylobacterota bacterium]